MAHLRLVSVNIRPRWRRPAPSPALQLIRGRGTLLALPRPRAATLRARTPEREPRSRVAELAFVVAMTAIGLIALATYIGQILARGM
ncbi:MAG: hypothetical protein FJ148_21515 [Deltaproteobacteria bacterium]|nr:hypothetical protein [Deltaproteobacteria bacterium]